jgi:integrase
VVTLGGKDIYIGPHGSKVSKAEYDRIVGEWMANGRRLPSTQSDLTVNELILAYWRFAEGHYTRDGKPTGHLANVRDALRPLRILYGHTCATEFGAAGLKAIRKSMIDGDGKRPGLCRNTVNGRISKLRSLFRWAVEEKLLPAEVLVSVLSVKAIKKGRDGVRETSKVRPVPPEHVAAVLPYLPAPIRAMVELQDTTGMRPGEVTIMRACDIDRSGDVWAYRPHHHKTDHLEQDRVIFLGPKAQAVVAPWLIANQGDTSCLASASPSFPTKSSPYCAPCREWSTGRGFRRRSASLS